MTGHFQVDFYDATAATQVLNQTSIPARSLPHVLSVRPRAATSRRMVGQVSGSRRNDSTLKEGKCHGTGRNWRNGDRVKDWRVPRKGRIAGVAEGRMGGVARGKKGSEWEVMAAKGVIVAVVVAWEGMVSGMVAGEAKVDWRQGERGNEGATSGGGRSTR